MLLMLLIGWTVVVPAVVVVGLFVASAAFRHRPWRPATADVAGIGRAPTSTLDPALRPDRTAAIRGPAGVGY